MEQIQQLIQLLQIAIPIAGGARIIYCLAIANLVPESEKQSLWPRIRNLLIFIVLAQCLTAILWLILNYFPGGAPV